MAMSRWKLAVGLILVAASLLGITGCAGGSTQQTRTGGLPTYPFTPVPFTLKDQDGKPVNLASYRGHPVVLEFFATWCRLCAYEAKWYMPTFQQWARANGVVLLGINGSDLGGMATPGSLGHSLDGVDGNKAPVHAEEANLSLLRQFKDQYHLDYPLLYDPGLKVTKGFWPTSFPALVIINANGTAVNHEEGVISPQDLENMVKQAQK